MQKTYRLAKDTPHAVKAFGPLFTLDKAQAYQADMALGGIDVLVVNCATDIDVHTHNTNWQKYVALAV